MDAVEKATMTQLQNIQKRSGKTLEALFEVIRESKLSRHAEIREMLQSELNMGYGDANTLAQTYLKTLEQESKQIGDSAKKPIHWMKYTPATRLPCAQSMKS